jgi:hypothetical protein
MPAGRLGGLIRRIPVDRASGIQMLEEVSRTQRRPALSGAPGSRSPHSVPDGIRSGGVGLEPTSAGAASGARPLTHRGTPRRATMRSAETVGMTADEVGMQGFDPGALIGVRTDRAA